MNAAQNLSDPALAVFAFAAYHQLQSGQQVSKVIRKDGNGHEAPPEAVQELQERGLAKADEQFITFEELALEVLSTMIEAMRRETGRA